VTRNIMIDCSLFRVLLVVEPDYLPDSEVCFSRAWTPFPNGGVGGISPPQLSPGGSRGGR
jgi:hypothetical protein